MHSSGFRQASTIILPLKRRPTPSSGFRVWLAKHAVQIDGIVGVTVGYRSLLNIKRTALRCNAYFDALSGVERRRMHVLPLTGRSVSDRTMVRVDAEVQSLRALRHRPRLVEQAAVSPREDYWRMPGRYLRLWTISDYGAPFQTLSHRGSTLLDQEEQRGDEVTGGCGRLQA